MARVKTRVKLEGSHESKQGTVVADPARLRHWADQSRKMRDAGLHIPAPWGKHVSDATPGSPFLSSPHNAGYAEELSLRDDGFADLTLNCPGLEVEDGKLVAWAKLDDGRQVKTAIQGVSPCIRKSFTDGKGKVWDDVITHWAIVPSPVIAGQEGFQALSLNGEQFLSLEPQSWSLAMPEGKKEESDPKPPTDKPADKPEDAPADPAMDGFSFDKLLAQLAEHGVTLPPDTTEENVCDRLYVALTALNGKLTPDGQEPGTPGDRTVQEQQPEQMMMSLDNLPADVKAKLEKLTQMEKAEGERRLKGVRDRFGALGLKKEVAARFFAPLGEQNLSLDAVNLDALEHDLSLLEAVAPDAELRQRVTDATAQPNSLAPSPDEPNPHLDDMVRMAGGKVKAKA